MASSAKAIELCQQLSVGINHYINTVRTRQIQEQAFEPTNNERQALLNLCIIFFKGIAQATPEELLLLVNFEVPNQPDSTTRVKLDFSELFISTVVRNGNLQGSLDDTYILPLEANAGEFEVIETLARSLIQKFPSTLIDGLVAEVKLEKKSKSK
jgi:hypothetical protein